MAQNPEIIVSSLDLDRLLKLLQPLSNTAFPGKRALEAELDRAEVVDPQDVPPTVVTMNSTIRFRMASSGETFCMRLTYPNNTDTSGSTISIFSPVGSALLGLSQGDEIEWPGPGGEMLRLTIEEVVEQPERAGNLHR